jgi:hypothetical protein
MSAVPSSVNAATCSSTARVYRRRRPERTALYRLVQLHLETWLACRRERDPDGVPVPCHVERELRGYLECGIVACGFARAHLGEPTTPPPLAPRARVPPKPETDRVGSAAYRPRPPPVRDQDTPAHALRLQETAVWTSYPLSLEKAFETPVCRRQTPNEGIADSGVTRYSVTRYTLERTDGTGS